MDLPPPAPDVDDVLAQPTRRRIFALLVERGAPLATAAIADGLALHPNGIRAHLDRLADAGLVERHRVASGPGRPADTWTVSPDAQPGGEAPTAYRELVRWLLRAMPDTPAAARQLEEAGRAIGREHARPTAGGAEALESTLASLGFAPHRASVGDETRFCLGNCPYREAVRESSRLVCTLHRGLTEGLLEQLEPQATLVEFTPRDPDTAGCTLTVSGLAP